MIESSSASNQFLKVVYQKAVGVGTLNTKKDLTFESMKT